MVGLVAPRARVDQDVRRLDVSVNQAAHVGRGQSVRRLVDDRGQSLRIERAVLEKLPQIGSLDVSHRDEEDVVGLRCLVDRDDVRMVEAGSEPGLAHETLTEGLVLAELWREQLQRDLALEHDVLRPIDDAHAAVPEQSIEAITRKLSTDTGNPTHVDASCTTLFAAHSLTSWSARQTLQMAMAHVRARRGVYATAANASGRAVR